MAATKMRPLEKFEANCTVLLVTTSEQQEKQNQHHHSSDIQQQQQQQQQQHQQQQQCDISLSAFSDIYNEYLSDHSEIETASTSDTDSSSSSTSISTNTTSIINNKENYERNSNNNNHPKQPPDIRNNLHNNQLFSVQLEVNFLLLEAERRKLKILQQELNLSLDECDKFERKKRNQSQCHELLITISRIQSQHNHLERELAEHTIDILKYSNIRIIEKAEEEEENEKKNISQDTIKVDLVLRTVNIQTMLNANSIQKPATNTGKPPIATKPKIVQKANYVVIAQQSPTSSDHSTQPRAIPTPPSKNLRNASSELNNSPLYHHHQHHRHMSEYSNDFLNKQQQRHNNNHNGTYSNGSSSATEQQQNDYNRHKNEFELTEKCFYTPSHSFDSSSSSSGGFKDLDFVAKTKAVYELYDKEEKSDYYEASSSASTSLPYVGHSKVQEIQSRLFAQQQQQQQNNNHHNHEQHLINRQQYQKSSKELEKLLGMRIEKKVHSNSNNNNNNNNNTNGNQEKSIRRLSKSYDEIDDNGGSVGSSDIANLTSKLAINISKQIQQKLQQEMKQQCEMIKEKFLIEKVPVQQHYNDYVNNRNQPAIGLKQNSKTRPTIFGTVASDQSPKDISSRRGLPQTVSGHQVISSASEEFDSDENTLIYRDGNLSSATLEALIQHMVPTNDYYPDRSYIFAFLLSSRLFIKPYQLLSKIWDLSQQQQNLKSFIQQKLAQNNPKLSRFSQYLIQLLAEWVDTFPYDFRDERLMSQIKEITQTSIQINPSLRAEVSQLLQNLLTKLQELEKYEEHLEKLNQQQHGKDECDSTNNKSPNNANGLQQQISVHSNHSHKSNSSHSSLVVSTLSHQSDISEICSSPLLLAHQLTHIELERLSHIGPEEFVQAFTKEHPSIETSFKDLKKTRNLESYVTWFNRLSYLVATDVIKHPKKKQRARIIEFWIETARESFNIGNFNSLMAIIAGLNMSPISRLKKTWAKIQSAKFSILEHQMDSSSNFSSYRSTLKAAMWRSAGATDERERIVIPFFSLLVKDLYFLNEGCSNKLPNGHINFEKFWQLAKQITEFIAWKQVTCPFERNEKLINYLQTTSILNECTLALASFECEPPENNHEKDHYKFLKNEVQK